MESIIMKDIIHVSWVVMKIGNSVPRTGLVPIYLAFRASVLPLHHIDFPGVTTIPTPTCLCSSLPQRSVQTTTYVQIGGKVNYGSWLMFILLIYWGNHGVPGCGDVNPPSVRYCSAPYVLYKGRCFCTPASLRPKSFLIRCICTGRGVISWPREINNKANPFILLCVVYCSRIYMLY